MRRNAITYIYILKCPKTSIVKYVGKTIHISNRLRKHLNDQRQNKRGNWIKGLISQGLKPILEVIDQVAPMEDWEERERHWIQYFRDKGEAFCNQTDGGESGSQQGVPISESHKRAISAANTGRKRSDLITYNQSNKTKKVAQYDLNGSLVNIFNGTHEAAEAINRNQRRLQAMCKHGHMNGKTINHVGGYVWRYVNDTDIKAN